MTAVGDDVAIRIERNQLSSFHKDIAEVIVQAVNSYGCKYRITSHSTIMVWPLDNSRIQTFSTRSRKGDTDAKRAREWLIKHVVQVANPDATNQEQMIKDFENRNKQLEAEEAKNQVEKADIVHLAEKINGPEHPVVAGEVVGEWQPYSNRNGTKPGFETNGTVVRCTRCEWSTENLRAVGGHERMGHNKEAVRAQTWSNTKANAKKSASLSMNAKMVKVNEALALLASVAGVMLSEDNQAYVKELETENQRLTRQVDTLKAQKSVITKRADEAEAKLALIREASGL